MKALNIHTKTATEGTIERVNQGDTYHILGAEHFNDTRCRPSWGPHKKGLRVGIKIHLNPTGRKGYDSSKNKKVRT